MEKNISKHLRISGIKLAFFLLLFGAFFLSCEKEEKSGDPVINYIRITDPAKSDSLVAHAFMGSNIAIVGENLQDVKEIWFNDQKAKLNTSFITNTTLIVTIPNVIPTVITNEIKMILGDKREFKFPFGIDVPAPMVSAMLCEYVEDGGTATIQGNYFINDPGSPLKVLFPGNIEGEVESVSLTEVKVKVPTGTGSGKISVKSIYGSTTSNFFFRDDRNIILNFDNLTSSGSWRSGTTREDANSLDKKYLMLKGEVDDNVGSEDYNGGGFVCELWGDANGRPNKNFFTGDLANYLLKFEANVKEWSGAYLNICFGPWAANVGGVQNQIYWSNLNARGLWRPWEGTSDGKFKTDGWITVTIPMSDIKYDKDFKAMSFDKEKAGSLSLWMKGPAATSGGKCKMEVYFDNIRIVPVK